MGSIKELQIGIGIFLVALICGWFVNAMGWCLFFGSLVWIGIHILEFKKASAWAQHPLRRPSNGLDSWFNLSYKPFRALQRERQRTRDMTSRLRDILGLVDVIPDGVIILQSNGDIEGMNQPARTLLHLSERDVGLGLATVLRIPEFITYIREETTREEPLSLTSPFNKDQSLEVRRFDTVTGNTIVLVRDITELNHLLTMRQNFIANVSHELRTPLTVMTGYLETLLDPATDTALSKQVVGRLQSPLSRMQTLVEDLMLLTQLESTPVTDFDPISLGQVVEGAVREMQGLCKTPDQISANIETEEKIHGAPSELHSVCVNLLSNALRYSPEGASIQASVVKHGKNVRLQVKDNGVGIAPEHLDRLTERFYRVDLAGAAARGGTGLGLAIVKHALLRHESSLQIESTLGQGSKFFCDFASISGAGSHE